MGDMRTGRDWNIRGRFALLVGIILCLAVALAACGVGATSAASATGTPSCAPTRTAQVQSVTGMISAVNVNALQVTDMKNGQVHTVELTSSTRITRIVTTSASSLTPGSVVQVTADSSETAAQRIVITPQGANGFGSRSGARGTPPAGFRPACMGTRTPGQAGQGTFRGGVRGTVSSATSTRVVVADAQGQTLTFAITPSTVILTTATATPSDLTVGSSVIVTGTTSGSSVVARMIVIQPTASK